MNTPYDDVAEPIIRAQNRIYEGRVVNLRVDSVEVPNHAALQTREVVEHPGAAVIVAQPDAEHVVLVRQWRHAARMRMWEIPAGTLDPDELPEQCAARELREETGFRAGRIDRIFCGYSAPGFCAELLHFYRATELTAGEPEPDDEEELLVRTFSLDELEIAISNGELPDVKTQLAVYWALRQRASKL